MVDLVGIATLISSVTASVVAITALVRQRNNKADTDQKLDTLHALTNGQSEKLNALTAQSSFAAGQKDQRDNPT